MIGQCRCSLTGGCEVCNPYYSNIQRFQWTDKKGKIMELLQEVKELVMELELK